MKIIITFIMNQEEHMLLDFIDSEINGLECNEGVEYYDDLVTMNDMQISNNSNYIASSTYTGQNQAQMNQQVQSKPQNIQKNQQGGKPTQQKYTGTVKKLVKGTKISTETSTSSLTPMLKQCVIDDDDEERLMYANTFQFNKSMKTISVGLDANNSFKFTIMLKNNRINKYITLEYTDWVRLMSIESDIRAYFFQAHYVGDGVGHEQTFFCNGELWVRGKKLRSQPLLLFRQLRKRREILTFTEEEFESILTFADIVKFYYQSISHLSTMVNNYYDMYLQFCYVKKKQQLALSDLFAPMNFQMHIFDFARVFHEIPIICKNKLKFDIKNFDLNKDKTQ